MKFAFFPGCVLKGAAAEAYTSMQKVCDALGIELEEIPNWTCCGASHAQGVNDLAALAVNARNISIAENMGLPILTVCNTCTLQLRQGVRFHDGAAFDAAAVRFSFERAVAPSATNSTMVA